MLFTLFAHEGGFLIEQVIIENRTSKIEMRQRKYIFNKINKMRQQ